MSSYYLGIDVSKGYSDFVLLDEHKTEAASPFQLDDTYLGHQRLYGFLKDFFSSHPEDELYCGLESTGGYENNWFLMLHQLQVIFPIQVARLNPMGVHNSQKADLKRTITDQISARGIAVKKLASFFGIHPIYKQSGDGTWGMRMSKNGRVAPRAILYMVALCAIDKNPLIKQTYQRHLDKGMNKSAAIGACMHKILRIIYDMLKHNKPFDPKIDQINQNKAKQKNKKMKIYNNQKWQNYDENAPISRKQKKKRKEQQMSQNEPVIKNGIVTAAS